MPELKLVKYPDPILLTKSEPVEYSQEIVDFIMEMRVFMDTKLEWGHALGLAAPQVGRNIRVFIALGQAYINPEFTWITRAPKNLHEEGCFSLEEGKFDYKVRRAPCVRMKWIDIEGKPQEKRFNQGQLCQVLQHEMDHLEGVLCCGEKV